MSPFSRPAKKNRPATSGATVSEPDTPTPATPTPPTAPVPAQPQSQVENQAPPKHCRAPQITEINPAVGRLGIDDIRPTISGGALAAKAVVGEVMDIFALIWREGHDAVAATVQLTSPKGTTTPVLMVPEQENPDQRHALVNFSEPGTWSFTIEAWSDPITTWRDAVTKKHAAGQSAEELSNDLLHGADLFDELAMEHTQDEDAAALLRRVADGLRDTSISVENRIAPAYDQHLQQVVAAKPLRKLVVTSAPRDILVERREALVNSWYELFPRSTGGWDEQGNPVHGTFATTAKALERVARMGFDTVYFPPIHPIGRENRKGKNNTLTPDADDVGSPWAIGSREGGHDAVHPELGTIEDFRALVSRAKELGLEVALDLALQAAPDHPWAHSHPEFFTTLADGTIAYAENPPKKYQDIYPLNFDNAPEKIYHEILRIVEFWIDCGVNVFRVDNPHTKPTNFWYWLIKTVHDNHPQVIFLAEAFTRPARLYGLSKAGFSQSYTYFTWKTSKKELTEFVTDTVNLADVSRPNLFVNTPDILHESLQYGGRAMFAIRATLAATISPLWGVYSGFELYEHEAVAPGSEEYLDSEKYQLRPRDFAGALERGDSLEPYITALNGFRRTHPALQQLRTLTFHDTDNSNVIAYSKVDAVTGDTVMVVVTLDPRTTQEATITVDLEAVGREKSEKFTVHDLVSGNTWMWGERNYVRLDPHRDVAHILEFPPAPVSKRHALASRKVEDYRP